LSIDRKSEPNAITVSPHYDELDEDDVKRLFKHAEFPSTANKYLGGIIRDVGLVITLQLSNY
jgi:hypothetical protein